MIKKLARPFARLRDESGMAMMLTIALTTILGAVSITVVQATQHEQSSSMQSVKRDASFQAAEAGMDDYTAKLLDDGSYELHNVHPYESTRRASTGTLVGPTCSGSPLACASNVWSYGAAWTYPSGKNNWSGDRLGNGFEYNLQVRPPSQGSGGAISVLATGRPKGSTDKRTWRTLFGQIRPAGVADFQMIADANISYGSDATTRGKIYAAKDAAGVEHSVNHDGTAYADIYAEGNITGSTALLANAKKYSKYTNPSVRSQIINPINFASFLASISAIKTAAALPVNGGLTFDAPGSATYHDAWLLTFGVGSGSVGTVTAQACKKAKDSNNNTKEPEDLKPNVCGTAATYNLPANGAIYAGQTAIVSGTVNGQVTVASADDVVIGGNLYYNDRRAGCSSGGSAAPAADDVLGLDATNAVLVAQYVPDDLNWCAATIAQTLKWQSAPNAPSRSHDTMTFTGSTATEDGGQMGMFKTRFYNYDPPLLWIQPPWFPQIAGLYTVFSQRELPGAFGF